MRIALTTTKLASQHQGRGIGTYTSHLLKYLKLGYPHDVFTQTANPQTTSFDLIHYPSFDFFYPTLPLTHPCPVVITIHDVIPLLFPKHFPRGVKGRLNFIRQKLALLSAKAILTDSKVSAEDLHRYLGISRAKIFAIHLAPNDSLSSKNSFQITQFKRQHSLPSPLIGYVGDINYNKNLPRLLEAVAAVPSLHLALVTRANLDEPIPEAQAIMTSISRFHLTNRIHFLSLPQSDDLSLFYQSLDFYIQPSLYEGFGLPVLEAMSLDVPVLAAQAGSLPEIAGEAPLYFNPYEVDSLTATLNKALSLSSGVKRTMSKNSHQQAHKYSWTTTAKLTMDVYQSILQKNEY